MLNKEQEAFMINLAHLVDELTKRVNFISNQLVNKANDVNQKLEPGFGPDGKLEEISLVKEKENKIDIHFDNSNTPIEQQIMLTKLLMETIVKICNELKIDKLNIDYDNQITNEKVG